MSEAKILGFFNPQREGDKFKGLNGSIEGRTADRVIGNLQEFLREAGRDYYIAKRPALVSDPFGGVADDGSIVETVRPVEGQYHLCRSSDGLVVSPHTVSGQYAPLTLMDMAEELQPWTDQGWASPDGVFEAKGGSLELLTLRLDAGSVDTMPDGESLFYIAFSNPHGSGGTAKGRLIRFRVVCANTFAAAVASKADFAISHRAAEGDDHKAIMADRVKEAVSAWETAKERIRKLAERIGVWAGSPLSVSDAQEIVKRTLDIAGKAEDKVSTRAQNRADAILSAFNMPQFGTYGKNAADLANAFTFANSSPLADINKPGRSKVSGLDRFVRSVDTNGTGLAFEAKAIETMEAFIGVS